MAYEVRISDWSSDLCSSDLREVGAQGFLGDAVTLLTQLFTVETAVPALQVGAASFGRERLQLFQVQGGKWFAAFGQVAQEAEHLKLGSASCRERVRPYV